MPEFTLHTSLLFDPKQKKFVEDTSITADPGTGLITKVSKRKDASIPELSNNDIDLRRKVVMPGFVDAHTHIFLHSYEYVSPLSFVNPRGSI